MLDELAQVLQSRNKITVLTGAGISTASGIPDFRSQGGIYKSNSNLMVEDILSETFYISNPELFWKYFKDIFRLNTLQNIKPNPGHLFFKELEEMGKEVTIITQNVDGLHTEAGSKNILEVHGNVRKARCPNCKMEFGLEYLQHKNIPQCSNDGTVLKPDIVLYEGRVKHVEDAYKATCEAEVFLAVGTSLQVYPIKELPRYIQKAHNIYKVLINLEPTPMDSLFNLIVHDDINTTFQKINRLL
ncbi:NAD-dependent protein deacylase [Paenibacillus sp. NPDC056579]|uniref:NAD-dependent protein deacylase n=1 Tax=Paenibacillus sp. NPDC056579 TaxID=3345871 RepID=UPI0036D10616